MITSRPRRNAASAEAGAAKGSDGLAPAVTAPPPGPCSRALARLAERYEAPGVNTVPAAAADADLPIVWQEARGSLVIDADGNRYIDLTSGFGVAAVGHRHPAVVRAVRRQAGQLLHGLGDVSSHPRRIELAERLAALAPLDDPQVFFATSGAEAVEIALKTALAATGRPGIVAFAPSYHGVTLGALAATSRPAFRDPFAAWLHPEVRRLPFGCPPATVAEALAGRATGAADGSGAGRSAGRTAPADAEPAPRPAGALLVEPIVGREGVLLPPPGWLAAVAECCRATGTVFIADEIFTGFGRTGALFVSPQEGVRPDLLCCGKALGGGMPIAAVLGRRPLFAAAWSTPGEALHTSTFLAHPLACAAALTTLDVMARSRLPERAARLGGQVERRLCGWPPRHPHAVTAIRGRGLLWGIELRTAGQASRLVAAARQRGVLLLAGGPEGRVAQIVPPLNISRALLTAALAVLEECLGGVAGSAGSGARHRAHPVDHANRD